MLAETLLFRQQRRALEEQLRHVECGEPGDDRSAERGNELARLQLATIDVAVETRCLTWQAFFGIYHAARKTGEKTRGRNLQPQTRRARAGITSGGRGLIDLAP
jgi:hypothetical protein